jgi:hypothetical protein
MESLNVLQNKMNKYLSEEKKFDEEIKKADIEMQDHTKDIE